MKPVHLVVAVFVPLAVAAQIARAQQVESPVPCNEGAEPLALAYGDHTDACMVDVVTDVDSFTFDAAAGDVPRIVINATSNNMDPRIEIFDPSFTKIEDTFCSNICAFALEPEDYSVQPMATLTQTGTYTVLVSDSGTNESGSYQLQLELILPLTVREELLYDAPVADQVSVRTDMDFYEFQGVAGDEIRISVNGTANNMDPRLEIWDPNGTKLEDVACGNICAYSREAVDFALSPSATLPETGTYVLALSDSGADETGAYTVAIDCLNGSCDPAPPVFVPFDSPVDGDVGPLTDIDSFEFDAAAGDEIRISVNGTANNMDPRLEVWDPDGVKLEDTFCSNICAYSREGADFSISPSPTLPKTGTYRVKLSDEDVDDTGPYSIAIHCLNGSCDPVEPTRLSFVSPVSGSIDQATDLDMFVFEADAGTQIRVSVNATANNMDPRLEIWDPGGDKLENDSCSNICTFSRETPDFEVASASLPETGVYRLAISDAGVNEGGSYQVGISCLDGRCDSDGDLVLDPLPPPLSYGTQVGDSVEPATDLECRAFYGEAGWLVRLGVNATTNNMDPRLEVRDPSDVVIDDWSCSNTCSYTRDLMLAATGTYRACISDSGVNETGAYSLGLQCLLGACADDATYPPDLGDNCVDVANEAPFDCDVDGDGFGDLCDGDFDQNGVTNSTDFADYFLPDFMSGLSSGTGTDTDCNGVVNSSDFAGRAANAPNAKGGFVEQFQKGRPGPGDTCSGGACP